MTLYILTVFFTATLYFLFRFAGKRVYVLLAVQLISLALVFPIYFTYLEYSSSFLCDAVKMIFPAIAIASFFQKGWRLKIIPTLVLVIFFAKGSLLGVYFWQHNYDYQEKSAKAAYSRTYHLKAYSISDYVIKPYYSYDTTEHFWHGKKLFLNGLLWSPVRLSINYTKENNCKVKATINDRDKTEVFQVDTCDGGILTQYR